MLAGDRIFVRVRFPVFILMCLSDAFVVKCDKISIEARIKEKGKLREQQAIAKRMKSRDMDITEISDLKIKTVNAEAGKQSCGNGSGAPLFSTIKV